jgi:GNAT superfamily N-acetyltransferase
MLKQVQHDGEESEGGTLLIRDATEADLPAIVAMLADDVNGARREDPSLPLDSGYLDAFLAIESTPNLHLFVAERDGTLVGTFQLYFLPGLSTKGAWRAQIEAVRVASHLRGQGYGAQMIEWAIVRAKAHGAHVLQLTTMNNRADAHRFYARLGFTPSHVGMKLYLKDHG